MLTRCCQVRLATDTGSDELVALKIMQKEWIWKNNMSNLVRREIDIMRGRMNFTPCTGLRLSLDRNSNRFLLAHEQANAAEIPVYFVGVLLRAVFAPIASGVGFPCETDNCSR